MAHSGFNNLTGEALMRRRVGNAAAFLGKNRLMVGGGLAGIGIYNAANTMDKLRSGDGPGAMLSGSLAAGAGYAAHQALLHKENYRNGIAFGAQLLKKNVGRVF